MLTEVNLAQMLEPLAFPSRAEVIELCLSEFEFCGYHASWSVDDDARITVIGCFEINRFIKNGRLIAPFHYISAPIRINGIRTLEGFPITCNGTVDIRTLALTSLKGCPKTVISLNVEAPLTSLYDGPESVMHYAIRSERLSSLAGLSKTGIENLTVDCKNVKTTDGLNGASFTSLCLVQPVEITEYPSSCEAITLHDVLGGYPKLFLTEGLREICLGNIDIDNRNLTSSEIFALHKINNTVLALKEPRKRFLEAQRQLIDADLERLL